MKFHLTCLIALWKVTAEFSTEWRFELVPFSFSPFEFPSLVVSSFELGHLRLINGLPKCKIKSLANNLDLGLHEFFFLLVNECSWFFFVCGKKLVSSQLAWQWKNYIYLQDHRWSFFFKVLLSFSRTCCTVRNGLIISAIAWIKPKKC